MEAKKTIPKYKLRRSLAISALLITHNISFVAGFQSLSSLPTSRLRETCAQDPGQSPSWPLYSVDNDDLPDNAKVQEQVTNNEKQNDRTKKLPVIGIEPNGSKNTTTDGGGNNNNNLGSGVLAPPSSSRKRNLGLMWCSEDFCKDAVRERVRGEHNAIVLDGPATGQVAYYWKPEKAPPGGKFDSEFEETNGVVPTIEPHVLLLVRPNDDDLIKVAADAVTQLTSDKNGIHISVDSSLAGKLKFRYGVDNQRIHLFEPKPMEGFGGSHVDSTDKVMKDFSGLPEDYNQPYDLICTLGGDGLLMHASMLFQGPVPPVISIAGGSLGFLTQFSKEEMVDAIRIALGVTKKELKNQNYYATPEDADWGMDHVFPPNMPAYPYAPLQKQRGQQDPPRFSFGYGDRICLSIRMRLDCRIFNPEGVVRARFNVLNEVVIDRGSSPYLAALECFCDDVHLTTVMADGVIFATPTGSTAYSMAAGGSVVHPSVPCILVTPICPHVLSFRSMVFPDHVVLRCYVPDDARADAAVAFDGKYRRQLHRGDSLQIKMSPYPVPTLNRADHSSDWLGSLKRSFNFNTRPRQKPL